MAYKVPVPTAMPRILQTPLTMLYGLVGAGGGVRPEEGQTWPR